MKPTEQREKDLESFLDKSVEPQSPYCHLKPMQFHIGEDDSWWECDYCGHTKEP